MKTLVLGGDGFVGRHLLSRLSREGGEIAATTLSDRLPEDLGDVEGIASEWCTLDVLDASEVAALFERTRPDRAFHLAGVSSSAAARKRPAEALRVNAEGTLHVLTAAAATRTPGPIVVTGSADAYGRPAGEDAVRETTPLRPETAYGVSKAAQEIVALGTGRAHALDVRVARLFPLVGPGQAAPFVVPSFCRRALRIAKGEAEPTLRVGNLDIERDFTDVRDGVEALARIAGLDRPADPVFNVGSGRGTPVRRLLDWVLAAAEIDPEVLVDEGLVRAGEPRRVVGDIARLTAATGWRVERDLQATVGDTFRWTAERGVP